MNTIEKSDFMAIKGYYGDVAIVDKNFKNKIKKLSIEELLEQGYYRAAVAAAVYDGDEQKKDLVLQFFMQKQPIESFDFLEREFGINIAELSKISKTKNI